MTVLTTSPSQTHLVRFEGNDYPIIFVQDVPPMRYHGAPLHFMSESGMSQQEYKHAAITHRYVSLDDTQRALLSVQDCSERRFIARVADMDREPRAKSLTIFRNSVSRRREIASRLDEEG